MAEFADDRVYKQSEIKKLVRADMLIELPPVLSTKDEDTQRRMRWLAVSMGSAAFVVMMAGTVFNYLKH
jgi:hypothetical protein